MKLLILHFRFKTSYQIFIIKLIETANDCGPQKIESTHENLIRKIRSFFCCLTWKTCETTFHKKPLINLKSLKF
jgi:hypothetical protein